MGSVIQEQEAVELLQGIWEAALEPGTWAGPVANLAGLFGAPSAKAALLDLSTGKAEVLAAHEIDPEFAELWASGEGGRDLWAEAGLSALQNGGIASTGAQLVPIDEYRRSQIYHEVSGPSGHEDCLATAIALEGSRMGFVSLYRSELFDRGELEQFELLAVQLRRAVSLQAKVTRRAVAHASLESVFGPALICDAAGRIEATNVEVERLLREADGLYSCRGRVHAREPEADRRLQRVVAEAGETARGKGTAGSGMLAVRRLGRPALGALAVPAPGHGTIPPLIEMAGGPSVLLVMSDPESRPELSTGGLMRIFGLTPAEADLARELARGASVTEYARIQGLSVETVRTRMRDILHKTGVHRQVDLVRLLLTSVAARGSARTDDADD
ncbi:MAG: helix-turn-helix transcriptional regulator [Myxococcota bacterium]